MRESRYNVVLERDELTWIHNGLSGRTVALPGPDWSDALAFIGGDHARMPAVETLRDLTLARMFVNDDTDELASSRATVPGRNLRPFGLRAHHRHQPGLQLRLSVLLREQAGRHPR